MAIQVQTYQSAVAPTAFGDNIAPMSTPMIDITDTADAKLIDAAATAGQNVAKKLDEDQQREKDEQTATDIVNAELVMQKQMMAFERDYQEQNVRGDARGAAEAYEQQAQKLSSELGQKFAGDARASNLWKRSGGQITLSAMRRGNKYAVDEDRVYKKETTEAATATYLGKVGAAYDQPRVVNNLRAQLDARAQAINGGKVDENYMRQVDLDTAMLRINAAVANKDADTARAILEGSKDILGKSYGQALNLVERAKVVEHKEAGVAFSQKAFNAGDDASETWASIAKIKDQDERKAAQSQYAALWSTKSKMDEEQYKKGALAARGEIDTFEVNDVGAQQASVDSMPETSETERRVKDYAQKLVDANKAGIGIDRGSDAASYLDLRDKIMGGEINTREQVESDVLATQVTERDRKDLINTLKSAQKATDKSIEDSYRNSMGAKKWKKLKKVHPDRAFDLIQRVKSMVQETNRGQDTGYIQQVTDQFALEGYSQQGALAPYMQWGSGTTIGEVLESGEHNISELSSSIQTGDPIWLPKEVPPDFATAWDSGSIGNKKSWKKLYKDDDDKAKRAAYAATIIYRAGAKRK